MPKRKKSGGRVLVVDDNKAHNYVLGRILQEAGYQVEQAYTGKEALGLVAKRPQMILLDVHLPDVNGFELSHQLREASARPVPIVFMSATDVGAAAKMENAQVASSGFLTQPVEPGHLLAVVQGVLAGSGPRPVKEGKSARQR